MAVDKGGHGVLPVRWDSKGYAAIPFGLRGAGEWVTSPVDIHDTIVLDLSCNPNYLVIIHHYSPSIIPHFKCQSLHQPLLLQTYIIPLSGDQMVQQFDTHDLPGLFQSLGEEKIIPARSSVP